MADFLGSLVRDAKATVEAGYYDVEERGAAGRGPSLMEAISRCRHAAIIAEVKPASPSRGLLRSITSVRDIALAIERGGAVGVSVLTEPRHFRGSIGSLAEVRSQTRLPVLMKDIIVDPVQVEAAAKMGASAVLLIYQVFSGGYVGRTLSELVELAHSLGLEVLLEAGSEAEFSAALRTEADMVGINNRDLRTLKVDLGTTRRILTSVRGCGRIVVSESGIEGPEDVRLLHRCGANAFLIGSAVMLAENVEEKVRELVLSI